ncbi:MAG: metallophosphoesterase [Clostridium sp.]|nr:metallophosphoesterase [Clostridium sp.]MCM1444167.1 metallophosphoesterase [Candidatus Amulumruptor caecigallinarius]
MRVYINKHVINSKVDLNIVHISDIHYHDNYNLKNLDKIVNSIDKLNPNYICITGDLIDTSDISDENIDKFCIFLTKLTNISKVIVVLGNHDVISIIGKKRIYHVNEYFISKLYNIKNLYLLRNSKITFTNITFIGYEPSIDYYEIMKINNFNLPNLNKENFNILLTHIPDLVLNNNINVENIDLILCGHTHGGLMPEFIKGNMGLISPTKEFFPKNVRGIITLKNTELIISSGITKLSKLSHLSLFNGLYSSNIVNIIVKTKVIKSKNIY